MSHVSFLILLLMCNLNLFRFLFCGSANMQPDPYVCVVLVNYPATERTEGSQSGSLETETETSGGRGKGGGRLILRLPGWFSCT